MSIDRLSLLRREQQRNQELSEEASTEEQQAEQESSSEAKEDEEQLEQKEGEETREARYDRLMIEKSKIRRYREVTFLLSAMQSEGLQTLIDEYGSDSVFDVIKNKIQSTQDISTLNVIRALEPDRSKRAIVYEKMISDALDEGKIFDTERDIPKPYLNQNHYFYRKSDSKFDQHWGNGDTFSRTVQMKIEEMKNLDSFLGNILPQRYVGTGILPSRMGELGSMIAQDEGELRTFKQELEQSGNNIFQLAEQRGENVDNRIAEWRAESYVLQEELSTEIQRITTELHRELEEYRSRIISDLSKLGNLKTVSEEMRLALEDALSKVEGEIITRVDASEKKIEEKTAPLHEMMKSLQTSF